MPKPRREIELHFIGEVHTTNPELKQKNRTFARVKREIEKAKKENKKVAVTVELPHEYVEKLKMLKEIDGKIKPEHIIKLLGAYYPVEDIANLIKEYKDVDFFGIDHDLMENFTNENVKDIIKKASRHEFIKKALDQDVTDKLSKKEKEFLFSTLVEVVGRNEHMKDKIKEIIKSGEYDKIIHIGGSAHSTIATNIKRELKSELPEIEVNLRIQHNLDKKFKEMLEKTTGTRGIRYIQTPHDTLIRIIDIGKLDSLHKDEIIELLKKSYKLYDDYLTDRLIIKRLVEEELGVIPNSVEQIASALGTKSIKNTPAKEMSTLVEKILRKHREKSR